jgi:hypothetical protein
MKALLPILLILAVSCSAPDNPQASVEAPADAAPDPSVFDDLTGTIDRAQGVEDTLRDSAADRRRQLEEAEGR